MNIITLDGKKVFDGSDVETAILPVNFDNHRFIIPANELKPIYELVSFSNSVKPNEISSLLGCKITTLGKLKVFHGRKKGLTLYFHLSQLDNKPILLIFSLGEYQLGRVMCFFESAIGL
ncbi:hypothetical protein [Photobacterium kasasachensis]|uniref:hypothetical protein n=1 Tax=Photobacterium kasasachensis TaxID=2910240 RepID=UPI003D0C9B26